MYGTTFKVKYNEASGQTLIQSFKAKPLKVRGVTELEAKTTTQQPHSATSRPQTYQKAQTAAPDTQKRQKKGVRNQTTKLAFLGTARPSPAQTRRK